MLSKDWGGDDVFVSVPSADRMISGQHHIINIAACCWLTGQDLWKMMERKKWGTAGKGKRRGFSILGAQATFWSRDFLLRVNQLPRANGTDLLRHGHTFKPPWRYS